MLNLGGGDLAQNMLEHHLNKHRIEFLCKDTKTSPEHHLKHPIEFLCKKTKTSPKHHLKYPIEFLCKETKGSWKWFIFRIRIFLLSWNSPQMWFYKRHGIEHFCLKCEWEDCAKMTEIINSYDAVLRSWIEIVRYDILIQTLVADIQNSVIYLSDKIECTESDNNNNNKVDRCLARYS